MTAAAKKLGQELLAEISKVSYIRDEQKIHALIAQGASLEEKDKYGLTALHRAAQSGNAAVVESLLAHGVPVDEKDMEGATTLFKTAQWGFPVIAKILISHGANVDEENNNKDSALGLAVRNYRTYKEDGCSATADKYMEIIDMIDAAVNERAAQKKQDAHDTAMNKIKSDIRGGLKHDLPPITPLSACGRSGLKI